MGGLAFSRRLCIAARELGTGAGFFIQLLTIRTCLGTDTLARGTVQLVWSIAGLIAKAITFVMIEIEVWKTPGLPDAFACACASVQLLTSWAFNVMWAYTAAFGFIKNL